MPEGDSIHRIQQLLRPALAGYTVESFWARTLKGHRPRSGMTISEVRAHGKHLLVDFKTPNDRTLTLDTHLGMVGSWRLAAPETKVSGGHDPTIRILITTAAGQAICRRATTIRTFVHDGQEISALPGQLGPDLTTPQPELDLIAKRAERVGASGSAVTIAELLLDQKIGAGIGNIYKSETLFLEGVWPFAPVQQIDTSTIRRLYQTAAQLLHTNVKTNRPRQTVEGGGFFVYDRWRLPCRRCGTAVSRAYRGLDPSKQQRSTYWCTVCQPASALP